MTSQNSHEAVSRTATAVRDTALDPQARLASSERKIRKPFQLDPSMRFYSPQTNVDALSHPRVVQWLDHIENEWLPTAIDGTNRRLALLMPCTKYKPYLTSREHRSINAALLAGGWRPGTDQAGPPELHEVLSAHEDQALLAPGPLVRDGVVLDRFIISEPLALVPYELQMYFRGSQSPACSYDDPGLFESRGTSVSPERPDCTARQRRDGTWAWGPAEREAYALMHNHMADALASTLTRLAGHYNAIIAWTSPGPTHRSFLADSALRETEGIAQTRQGSHGTIRLRGVLDAEPGLLTIHPTREEIAAATEELTARLAAEGRTTTPASVRSVFARGDGHDTPLGLPELAAQLGRLIDLQAQVTA